MPPDATVAWMRWTIQRSISVDADVVAGDRCRSDNVSLREAAVTPTVLLREGSWPQGASRQVDLWRHSNDPHAYRERSSVSRHAWRLRMIRSLSIVSNPQ